MHPGVRWVFAKRFLCIFSCSHITGKKNRLNLFIHSLTNYLSSFFSDPREFFLLHPNREGELVMSPLAMAMSLHIPSLPATSALSSASPEGFSWTTEWRPVGAAGRETAVGSGPLHGIPGLPLPNHSEPPTAKGQTRPGDRRGKLGSNLYKQTTLKF